MAGSMKKLVRKYWLDVFVLLAMCSLLFYGASWQMFSLFSDAARYQCYAEAFWNGQSALKTLPSPQCNFILYPDKSSISSAKVARTMRQQGLPNFMARYVAAQSSTQRFQALPYEYPILTLAPFSLGLSSIDPHWYQVAFALWMLLIAVIVYIMLARYRSRRSAIVYAIYLTVAGWATLAGRFDIIPAALTLGALLCAVRARWKWSFALLALATMFKFYPLVLLIPFLLAQQMQVQNTKWYAWRRWVPLGTYAAVCAAIVVVSLLLNVGGTLAPLSYFDDRPIQVESLAASVIWLSNFFNHSSYYFDFTFGSLNIFSPLSSGVSLVGTLLLIAGLLYTCWLQWQRKIDLAVSCLLILLIVVVMGKIFSPQYLIWLIPFLAYVGEFDLRWVVSWVIIGVLTSWIYPSMYLTTTIAQKVPEYPLFFPVITARNFILLAFVLILLFYCSRRRPVELVNSTNRGLHPVPASAGV
ncbi:MAG TPA: glycosyltransferase family 87 protein [Ktedonobacteraceae bacterium]|nr:glycosyltransferase family 87 protein [Ktedonobacteraceae bacterium]